MDTPTPSPATNGPVSPAQLKNTNDVLFDLWFPIGQLPIPPRILPDIEAIAEQVKQDFLNLAEGVKKKPNPHKKPKPGPFLAVLAGMTDPKLLPFYEWLAASDNPVIKWFLGVPGGVGSMGAEGASQVLSFFFRGADVAPDAPPPVVAAGAAAAEMAMIIREAYLSTIWDLPLAGPLTGIQDPATFTNDPALYAKTHYPTIPPSRLVYDPINQTISAPEGPIDYLIIGSGPAGATMAAELQRAGKLVVLIEQGPFVVWGSMNTMSYPALMYKKDRATTSNNGILVRSGQAMGGGTTVNIDLAFSPLESTIQYRLNQWLEEGRLDKRFYTLERISAAYQWVRNNIGTRAVTQAELNQDNLALWEGASAYGVDPSLYHLNRFPLDLSPSPVTQKRDAARQLILGAMQDERNPLSVLPDVAVQELLFSSDGTEHGVRATGVSLLVKKPWTKFGNTIVDPCNLHLPPKAQVTIAAQNVILSAGTIGSARLLLHTAAKVPALNNPHVGKGLIMHPSFPLIGLFEKRINLLEGLDSATFLESFGVTPGFIFETMSGMPAYGALLIPGSGKQVYDHITKFNHSAGFGVMLVDTPSPDNRVELDPATGEAVLVYQLSDGDKQRFREGVAAAIRMMFLAGARQVMIPTNENVLQKQDFDPMHGVYLDHIDQADIVGQHLHFIPNRTLLTSAHLQATNKLGTSADNSVASPRQRIWNCLTGEEIPNLYLMDSSMFPTSVGANPMQSLYTLAKIFAERLIHGLDTPAPLAQRPVWSDQAARGPERVTSKALAEVI